MNTSKTIHTSSPRLMIGAATLFAVFLALSGCSEKATNPGDAPAQGAKAEQKGLKLSPEEQERAGIKLESVTSGVLEDVVSVTATIHPNKDRFAKVAPRVDGRIVGVTANLGDLVRAGQTLAVMDSMVIGEAQSALLQAQSAQRVAQADFKRAESLSAEEIIPQRDFLRARGEFEKTNAELRAAQDKLRLLGGSASTGDRAESTFALIAPFAGTVIQKKATIGEIGVPSEAVFTLADLSVVWIESNLTEDLLAKVKIGAPAFVTVGAYPQERFSGRVTYVSNILDKESRTTSARIEVTNKDGRLKPEMFATAMISTGGQKQAISVPDSAILLLQGQSTIFVVENGSFESRAIESGEKLAGRTVIKSGLKAGEQVVVAGAYALKAQLLKSQIGDAH